MSILSGTYIFYADVYFVQNFIIKTAVLYLSLYCNKLHFETSRIKGVGKICLASGLGTMMEIAGLLLGGAYEAFILCVHLVEVPLMILFVLGKNRKQMLRVIVTGYFFIMLINGVLEALWNRFGEDGSYIIYLIFVCGVVIVGVRIWKNYSKMQKGIFPVELSHKGKRVATYGFYDSGNRLKDPYTGKGVHIVSEQVLVKLGTEEIAPVYIPYQALGNADGMIAVYYIDEMIIEGETQRKSWQKCPLGVTKDNLFKESKYEMILNEEVF